MRAFCYRLKEPKAPTTALIFLYRNKTKQKEQKAEQKRRFILLLIETMAKTTKRAKELQRLATLESIGEKLERINALLEPKNAKIALEDTTRGDDIKRLAFYKGEQLTGVILGYIEEINTNLIATARTLNLLEM